MDNFTPSGPQPFTSTEQASYDSGDTFSFNPADTSLPGESGTASSTENAAVTAAKNLAQGVQDFVHAQPLACMAAALVTGAGLAALTLSIIEPARRPLYGPWS